MPTAQNLGCVVVEGGVGVVAVRFCNLVAGYAITREREVKPFVAHCNRQAVGHVGGRVADEGLVAVVDCTVIVQVDKDYVARFGIGHDGLARNG